MPSLKSFFVAGHLRQKSLKFGVTLQILAIFHRENDHITELDHENFQYILF
jgi:hypothetical protein